MGHVSFFPMSLVHRKNSTLARKRWKIIILHTLGGPGEDWACGVILPRVAGGVGSEQLSGTRGADWTLCRPRHGVYLPDSSVLLLCLLGRTQLNPKHGATSFGIALTLLDQVCMSWGSHGGNSEE